MKTQPKKSTPDQLIAAHQAITANPAIKTALESANISIEEWAANAGPTLERLEQYKAARR